MRLIDADKLPITNTYALVNSKVVKPNKITFAPLACVLKSDIDNAPTVERIVCRSRDWSNECTHSSSFEQGYVQGYEEGKNDRPKGKWITVNLQQENDGGAFMCSCCKERSWDYGNSYHFCPNCGARMER